MRLSIVVAVLVVVGIAAGGAWYGLEVYPQQQFRAGLDQALAALPPGTTSAYKTAHYSVASHEAVVTGLTVHGTVPGDPPEPFDIAVDTIETTNAALDLSDSWSKAVAAPASYTPEMALPVADAVTLKGLTLRSAAINMTSESVRITKARLFPWALLHDGLPKWQEIRASLAATSEPSRQADLRPLLRVQAAGLLGIAYDSYEAGPTKVTEAVPGMDLVYQVKKVTGLAYDRGITQGAGGEGITGNSSALGVFAVDHVAIGASDFRAPMVRIINGEPLSLGLLDKATIGRVAYQHVVVQPPGQKSVNAGDLSIGPIVFSQGMPVSGELAQRDFHIARSDVPDPRAQDAFDKLGLDAITLSYTVAYNWDVPKRGASLHDTMLKVNELGTLALSLDMTNVVPDAVVLTQAELAHAKLRFEDASLVERLMRAGAAESGADPTAFRQQVAEAIREQSTSGDTTPALQAAGQAASAFIVSPHSLTIELSPRSPVPLVTLLGALTSPGRSAAMLGLVVTANQ